MSTGSVDSTYSSYRLSRYSVACVRRSKKPSFFFDALLKTYFGQLQRFLATNGGEFANDEYREMCNAFNIVVTKTAALRKPLVKWIMRKT